MKKIYALIISLAVAAAGLTACGSGDASSGPAETSAASSQTESTAAESEAESTAAKDSSSQSADESYTAVDAPAGREGWGPLAKNYTEKLEGGVFSLDLTVSSAYNGEMSMIMDVNGSDAHLKTAAGGLDIEVYVVDGRTYSLMPSTNSYTVTENGSLESQNVTTYGLEENAQFVGTSEEDGMQIEIYKVPLGNSTESAAVQFENTVKFYFDSEGMAKKIVTDTPIMGSTTVVINSLSFEDVEVTLPDLSGMTRLEEGAATEVDPVDAVKMTLSLMGITEDMVKASGYTLEQLAEMEVDEMAEAVAKIAQENGIQ